MHTNSCSVLQYFLHNTLFSHLLWVVCVVQRFKMISCCGEAIFLFFFLFSAFNQADCQHLCASNTPMKYMWVADVMRPRGQPPFCSAPLLSALSQEIEMKNIAMNSSISMPSMTFTIQYYCQMNFHIFPKLHPTPSHSQLFVSSICPLNLTYFFPLKMKMLHTNTHIKYTNYFYIYFSAHSTP